MPARLARMPVAASHRSEPRVVKVPAIRAILKCGSHLDEASLRRRVLQSACVAWVTIVGRTIAKGLGVSAEEGLTAW